MAKVVMKSWKYDPETKMVWKWKRDGCCWETNSSYLVSLVCSDTDNFCCGLHFKFALKAMTGLSRAKLRQVCLETMVKHRDFLSSGLLCYNVPLACASISQPFSHRHSRTGPWKLVKKNLTLWLLLSLCVINQPLFLTQESPISQSRHETVTG